MGLECGGWREGVQGAASSTGRWLAIELSEVGVVVLVVLGWLFFVWDGVVLGDGGVLLDLLWLVPDVGFASAGFGVRTPEIGFCGGRGSRSNSS